MPSRRGNGSPGNTGRRGTGGGGLAAGFGLPRGGGLCGEGEGAEKKNMQKICGKMRTTR